MVDLDQLSRRVFFFGLIQEGSFFFFSWLMHEGCLGSVMVIHSTLVHVNRICHYILHFNLTNICS